MAFDLLKLIIFSSVVVLGLLGLVGNIISLVVWTRPQMKSSSAILLTALSLSDLVIDLRLLSRAIPGSIISFNAYIDNSHSPIAKYMEFYILPYVAVWMFPIFRVAITASTYLSVAITLERYIAVCFPFQFHEMCTHRRACVSATAVFIFSILFNLSRFFENDVKAIYDEGNIVGYKYIGLKLMGNPLYISVYRAWLHLFINYLLPLAGIIILNTAIYLQLKRANRDESLGSYQKTENRLAMMLLYVVMEFLVCTSITGFLAIWRTFGPYDATLFGFKLSNVLDPISLFFDTFNSSVNFVTYVTFWMPFRRTFLQIFCCRKESGQHLRPENQDLTSGTKDTLV